MKKIFTLLLAVAASIGTMRASDTQVDGIWYDFNSSTQTASVTYRGGNFFDYDNEYSGSVVIPASVIYNSVEYSVTSIGGSAFGNCSDLTSVTIPNSVTSIGNYAFWNCAGLTSVTIPNSVTSIGDWAFNFCEGLTSVTIPNSVTSIGEYAFSHCTGLTSITIPNSVTSIGGYAFYGCESLTAPVYNAYVFAFMPTSYSGAYTIPDGIESIADGAFDECSGLTSVTIGNSVTSIGDEAFSGCSGLTTVIWNAKNCADFASNNTPFYYYEEYIQFDLRPQITSFTFGNEVEHIPANLCSGMSNLTSVTIGNSVTSIGVEAFYGCTGLTSLTIPNSVTSIGNSAFSGCSGLTSATIGNSVTRIGDSAFLGCSGLTSVTIPNSVTSIGNGAFFDCSGLTSVTIGNSVTSIGDEAFSHCTGLTSVTIGNSVTSIGKRAFYNCTGLTSVTIPNSVTSIGDEAFSGCSGLTTVIWNAKNCADFASNNTLFYAYYYKEGHQYIQFDLRPQITSFTFGNEVEHIPANLCSGMSNLTSVTIEAETPPTLGKDAFYKTNECPIYVPCNAVNAYKTAWSGYAYRIVANCASYTITFVNWDGSNLQTLSVAEGEMPQYTGTTPTKPSDSQYSYTFSGWTPTIVAATEDATYTATFTATPKGQGIDDVQSDPTQCTKVIRDGQLFILRGDKTYTITGTEVQ